MEDLLELNRNYLIKQLNNINCDKQIYVVNDIIDTLSSSPTRDKSRVNKYASDYVYVGYAKRDNCLRQVRLFTLEGIAYYLHDGKITNYLDACLYFDVQPVDLLHKKYKKQFDRITTKCVNKLFKTSILLSWIYDKQKNIAKLCQYISADDALDFIKNCNTIDIPNDKKIKILNDHSKEITSY